jgi:hypothetical protein
MLAAWERGLPQLPTERALTLLGAHRPETLPEELAKLSIGRRDARLLALREQTFGPQLVCLANCPDCSERLEINFKLADLLVPDANDPGVLSLSVDGYDVQFRLPNTLDLRRIAGSSDISEGRDLLLQNCVLQIDREGESTDVSDLPPGVIAAIVEQMAQADPQADVQLALVCPSCDHRWQSPFDVLSYFWSEINAWAHRTLHDVHTLAAAYGWREPDILALSPIRRQIYLDLVNQ